MAIPLIQNVEKQDINTSIIAIKRQLEQLYNALGVTESTVSSEDISKSTGTPLGTIAGYEGTTDPADGQWLICDGRDTTGTSIELSTHYPSLYTFLGGTNVLPEIFDENVFIKNIWVNYKNGTNTNDNLSVSDIVIKDASKVTSIEGVGRPRTGQWDTTTISVDLTTATQLYYGFGGAGYVTTITGSYNSSNDTWVCSAISNSNIAGLKCYYKEPVMGATPKYKIIKATASTDTYTPPSSEIQQIESYFDNGINTIKNNGLSYSTTETLTGGKWIDGKPIYRKVIQGTFANTGGTTVNIGANLDVIHIGGFIQYGNARIEITASGGSSPCIYYRYLKNTGALERTVQGTFASSSPVYIIVEYTKSTD
jgi:hypothetical protein